MAARPAPATPASRVSSCYGPGSAATTDVREAVAADHCRDMSTPAEATRAHHERPLSVVIAAERASTRSALWSLLEREPALVAVGTASDLPDTVRQLRACAPDVVVIDTRILGPAGVERLPTLTAEAPGAAFIVVGMGDHPGFGDRARAAGAADYVRLDQASEQLAYAALAVSER
jgi:chemotaxis response regulator CheB